jgi:hypothetical protein
MIESKCIFLKPRMAVIVDKKEFRIPLEVENKDVVGKKASKLDAFMWKEGRKEGAKPSPMRLLLVGLAAENPDERKDFMVKLLIVYAFKGKVFLIKKNNQIKIFFYLVYI